LRASARKGRFCGADETRSARAAADRRSRRLVRVPRGDEGSDSGSVQGSRAVGLGEAQPAAKGYQNEAPKTAAGSSGLETSARADPICRRSRALPGGSARRRKDRSDVKKPRPAPENTSTTLTLARRGPTGEPGVLPCSGASATASRPVAPIRLAGRRFPPCVHGARAPRPRAVNAPRAPGACGGCGSAPSPCSSGALPRSDPSTCRALGGEGSPIAAA
jgi:hypothetical protein